MRMATLKGLKVYYAHSKRIYGTKRERKELLAIKRKCSAVIDPNKDIGERGEIRPYLIGVDKCQAVVCSEFEGYIGKGVFHEVIRAIETRKPVLCLRKNWLGIFKLDTVYGINIIDRNDWKIRYAKLIRG